MSQLKLPDLSLYIHIPWCIKKCPYCDFNSHQSSQYDIPFNAYTQQLLADLDADLSYVQNRKLRSIFIGGGTPSLFPPNHIENILKKVQQRIAFSDAIEITMEANPGSIENIYLKDFKNAGINRLSLGVQSFNDTHLEKLGRIHDSRLAKTAIENANKSGFNNINIDLMHGLPDQTIDQALDDIEQACNFSPNHISWYQLTLEPNTVFYSQPPKLPSDNLLDSIYDKGHELLLSKGFSRYETSAYQRNQSPSEHNLNYWRFGDYLGIGAGAHGKITLTDSQLIVRTQKTRLPKDYLAFDFTDSLSKSRTSTPVETQDRALEFFMNTLRISEGFDIAGFTQRTAISFEQWREKFLYLEKRGLISMDQNRVKTTELGARFLNTILEELNN